MNRVLSHYVLWCYAFIALGVNTACNKSDSSQAPTLEVSIPKDVGVAEVFADIEPTCDSYKWMVSSPTPLLNEDGNWYRYAPSSMVNGETTRVWACGNVQAGEVQDHILYSERKAQGAFSAWIPALKPANVNGYENAQEFG
jgi:hypothetical protein